MKTVTIQELRTGMGAMFHEIRCRRQSYRLTHQGKPVALLVPLDDSVEVKPDGTIIGGPILTFQAKSL